MIPDRWTGRVLGGRFAILAPLGRGGMARVYEAENLTIGRRVAIKILEPNGSVSRSRAQRFVREARALAKVNHPNVVAVLDVEVDRITSAHFIVQELLLGTDLRSLLRVRGRLSVDDALSIVIPIADALEATHRARLVHRDVTPANIFLARAGSALVPKLIDFGLAQALDPTRKPSRTIVGTPQYMAPEHAAGERVGAGADVWSLGAVLHRAVVGRAPHEVRSAPELPAPLAGVLRRALVRDPRARYSSMAAFAQDLRACTTTMLRAG